MKIRFIESLAGKGFVYGMGEVLDFPAPEAKYWIQNKMAVAVEYEEPEQQKVVVQRVKKTTKRPVK